VIQREGVYPYGFPHDYGALVRYGFNRTIDAHYHPSAVMRIAPFLWKYWHHSRPARHEKIAHVYAKLIEHCVSEHDALATLADAHHFLKRTGWMKVFRTERERDVRYAEAARWHAEYGLQYRTLDRDALREEEPHLAPVLVGGLHWTEPVCVDDPQGLALAYLAHFESRGGRLLQGNAASLAPAGAGWSVRTGDGNVEARDAVIALGPWADTLTQALGYDLPLAVKRGYHMHYRAAGQRSSTIRCWIPSAATSSRRCAAACASQPAPSSRGATPSRHRCSWARGTDRPRPLPACRAPRHRALDGCAPLHAGHAADREPRTSSQESLVFLRPRAPRPHARPRHRSHAGRHGRGEKPFVDPTPYRADRF
jgi:glycine/D-amino acid oxidase-like deaminating enzyme